MKKGFQNIKSELGDNAKDKTDNTENSVDCELYPRPPRIPMPPIVGNPIIFSFGGTLAGIFIGFLLKLIFKLY